MNCKGILRKSSPKTSPIKKRNLSTQMVNERRTIDTVRSIDHNHANIVDESINNVASKYQFSTIHTTQKKINKLQYLKNLSIKDATLAELSPRSKGAVAEKALKKLNIVSDKKVYKHLPPVNVNDSVLEVNRLIRKDKQPMFIGSSANDAEPTLQKYLKAAPQLEFRLELNDLEEIRDENLDRKQLANNNFQQLHDIYRKYLDPSKVPYAKNSPQH